MQEIWDIMERPNLQIIGTEEWKETQVKGTGNIFSKIIEKNSQFKERDVY